jgi:YVTN family beta-propeller protein
MRNLIKIVFLVVLAAFSPCFGAFVYILNNGDGTVSVLDEETLAPISGSPFLTVVPFSGQAGQGITTNPSGTRLYITNQLIGLNNVSVLDAPAFAPITGSPFPSGGINPIGIASYGNLVYVVNNGNGMMGTRTVSALDGTTLAIVHGPVSTQGINPEQLAVSPDGSRVYVANTDGVIGTFDASLAAVPGSPFPSGMMNARGIAINPAGTRLYITGQDMMGMTQLAVLDTATMLPIPGSPFLSGGSTAGLVAVNPSGTRVFVVNTGSSDLSVMDANTLALLSPPLSTGGTSPYAVAVNPSGTRVYVGNLGTNDIAVFNPETLAFEGLFMDGGMIPHGFAFSSLSAPTNLQGNQKKNDFGVVFERYNLLTWDASTSEVAGYFICRDGVKIATVGSGTLQYEDRNQKKGVAVLYSVTSFDSNGAESTPVSVTVR